MKRVYVYVSDDALIIEAFRKPEDALDRYLRALHDIIDECFEDYLNITIGNDKVSFEIKDELFPNIFVFDVLVKELKKGNDVSVSIDSDDPDDYIPDVGSLTVCSCEIDRIYESMSFKV